MGVLDVAAIKAQREEEIRIAEECGAWCVQAAREFAVAALVVGTPLSGLNARVNPAWPVTRVDGDQQWAEYWMLVRSQTSDNATVNLMFSAVVAPDGSMYRNKKQITAEDMGYYVAAVAGNDQAAAEGIFRSALLGRAVAER